MAEFTQADLRGARFDRVDLSGADLHAVDLSGARFRGVDLSGVVMRGAELVNVDIYGEIENLTVNGVDVGPLITAELDRRYPDRVKMRPVDPAGFAAAWDLLERLWGQTADRARRLPPDLLHESVDGEWSFIETLRHLVFATDAWVRRAILGDPAPWDPLDTGRRARMAPAAQLHGPRVPAGGAQRGMGAPAVRRAGSACPGSPRCGVVAVPHGGRGCRPPRPGPVRGTPGLEAGHADDRAGARLGSRHGRDRAGESRGTHHGPFGMK